MFGRNGNGQEQEPQSTASMWSSLTGGVGGLMKVISDPALQMHAHQMMAAIIAGSQASLRIEAKLDLLLGERGYDVESVNARLPKPPAILEGERASGLGPYSAPSGAPDNGIGGTAQGVAADGGALGSGGAGYRSPDDGAA